MSNVYTLRPVPPQPPDVVSCAETLSREAQAGHVTGIAYVAYLADQGYVVHACGDALDNIPLTRGMLLDLIDKLRA